jgi:hypothetical protein
MSSGFPAVKLSHDDNLAEYVRSDTTLILSGKTFAFTQNKVEAIRTSRLLVYSDVVLLAGHISCPGKQIRIHCNRLEWDDGTVIDVSGKPGETIAALAPQVASNGQSGGIICVHVHNLDIAFKGKKPTLWPKSLKFLVSGGSPGKCHESDKSWKTGDAGKTGEIQSSLVYWTSSGLTMLN